MMQIPVSGETTSSRRQINIPVVIRCVSNVDHDNKAIKAPKNTCSTKCDEIWTGWDWDLLRLVYRGGRLHREFPGVGDRFLHIQRVHRTALRDEGMDARPNKYRTDAGLCRQSFRRAFLWDHGGARRSAHPHDLRFGHCRSFFLSPGRGDGPAGVLRFVYAPFSSASAA